MGTRATARILTVGTLILMSLALAGCGDAGKVGGEVQPIPTPKGGVLPPLPGQAMPTPKGGVLPPAGS